MSLILDNLKKLKKQSGTANVPPGMINLAPKKRSKRPSIALLALLGVSVLGLAIVFWLDMGRSTSYKVTAPIQTVTQQPQNTPRPQIPQPPVQETPQISEDDIKARIDAAVAKALEDSAKDFDRKAKSTRDANIRRLGDVDTLPRQARPEVVVQAPLPKLPDRNTSPVVPVNGSMGDEVNKVKALQNGLPQREEEESPDRPAVEQKKEAPAKPILTDKQRKAFEKKIKYNTLVTTADRALESRNYDKAIENYTHVLTLKATPANLASLLEARIAKKNDISGVDRDLARFSNAVTEKLISITAVKMNNYGYTVESLALLKRYVGRFNNDGKLYYTAGQIHEANSDLERAEFAYGKAVDALPVDPYYVYAYARLLDTNEKYEMAIEFYENINKINADSNLKITAKNRANDLKDYLDRLKEEKEQKAKQEASENS